MSADNKENEDTCDDRIKEINNLIMENIPNPIKYPPGVITDMSKLTLGKSYKIHKVVDLKLGKIDTCGELRVTETTPETGYVKPPYYLVPTFRNKVGTAFESVGENFKKMHANLPWVWGGGAKSPENTAKNTPIPGGANRAEIIANKFHVFIEIRIHELSYVVIYYLHPVMIMVNRYLLCRRYT
jgi:hypothetical protein